MAKSQTPKKAKALADKAGTPVSKKSKPQMKAGPPKKKGIQKADQAVRTAIANGDVMKDELARKTEQDARTLYIRFSDKLPTSAEQVQELHSDIKFVRTPRKGNKKDGSINYAFLEFGDAEECKNAKNKLATTQFKGKEIYVDFVGENSVAKKKTGDKEKTQLNPTRLFVCGLAHGITKANLKEMFPKAGNADIPQKSRKKGTSFGFVQFSTPADAKAAFDAAQNLEVNGHRITVLFAKMTETKPEVQKKKAEKRKAKKEEKEKNLKKTKIDDDKENKVKVEESEELDEDDDEDDDEDEEELDDTVSEKKEESKDAESKITSEENKDDESDDDEEDDDDEDDDEEGVDTKDGGDKEEDDDDEDDDDDDDDDEEEDDE